MPQAQIIIFRNRIFRQIRVLKIIFAVIETFPAGGNIFFRIDLIERFLQKIAGNIFFYKR